ncbi:MAG: winged helix-turn-helix domain-containing protein [Agarilytica sp.]
MTLENSNKPSKTKTSFFRRLYVAHLIDSGINTVPAIIEVTGMPKRTAQDTILALHELNVDVEFVGANKNGSYQVNDWGAINKTWVENHIKHIKEVLLYP